MNIENITTVSDLIKENEALSSYEQAVNALTDCDYEESRKVVLWLLSNMLEFHKQQAVDQLTGNDPSNSVLWAHDAGKLSVLLETLKGIQ